MNNEKLGFIFALVAAIVMMTGCGKSNSNTGKTLELIIYLNLRMYLYVKRNCTNGLEISMRSCQKNIRQMKNRLMNSEINMI